MNSYDELIINLNTMLNNAKKEKSSLEEEQKILLQEKEELENAYRINNQKLNKLKEIEKILKEFTVSFDEPIFKFKLIAFLILFAGASTGLHLLNLDLGLSFIIGGSLVGLGLNYKLTSKKIRAILLNNTPDEIAEEITATEALNTCIEKKIALNKPLLSEVNIRLAKNEEHIKAIVNAIFEVAKRKEKAINRVKNNTFDKLLNDEYQSHDVMKLERKMHELEGE